MFDGHFVFLAAWLGTGSFGLLFGLITVGVVKRRLQAAAVPAQSEEVTDDELMAA
jgi:hypothetical protein